MYLGVFVPFAGRVCLCRCYTCDNDIPVEVSKRIQECVDFLRKQAGLPRAEFSHFGSECSPFVSDCFSNEYISLSVTMEMITIFSEKAGMNF